MMLPLLLLPAALAGVFPYPVHTKTLDNGLTICVIPMNSPGVSAVYTWFSVGSRDEITEGRSGFAHFFEHLMFYGTPDLPREAREDEILRIGADENAWTWLDETVYHAVLPRGEVSRYLDLQGDNFQHLALTAEDVRREAGAVYGEFRKGQADPDGRLLELMYKTAFDVHPYRHDTIGFEADIEDMPTAFDYSQTFFQTFYRPENATVVVTGDVKPEDVFAQVAKSWSAWPKTGVRSAIPVEPPQEGRRQARLDWPTSTAPRVAFGWRAPGNDYADPGAIALDLVGEILLSPIGPLHRRLVDDGLAYEVSGGNHGFVDPALFTVAVTVKEAKDLPKVEAIVREEIEKLRAGVDADVLTRTRTRSRYQFLSSLDDPDEVASRFGWAARRGGIEAIDRYFGVYDAQTPETVSAAATKYLEDRGLTVVTLVGPEAP